MAHSYLHGKCIQLCALGSCGSSCISCTVIKLLKSHVHSRQSSFTRNACHSDTQEPLRMVAMGGKEPEPGVGIERSQSRKQDTG